MVFLHTGGELLSLVDRAFRCGGAVDGPHGIIADAAGRAGELGIW